MYFKDIKKYFAISAFVLFIVVNTGIAQTAENTPLYKNAITVGFSYEAANNNGQYAAYSVEYNRFVKGRFSWGVAASFREYMGTHTKYDIDSAGPGGHDYAYRNTLYMDIPTLMGMIYYEFPVAKWLSFRSGAGLGVGYHIMRRDDSVTYKDKIAPYLQVRLQWIIRPWERVEICVAPLVLGPSIGAIAPWVFGPPSDKNILAYFNAIHIQIGYRF